MPADPAISVVVPFHRSEATIGACLDSLLAQEPVAGGHELLFIDNDSPDGSRALVERHPEVRLLTEAKPGAYAARNAGIRAARGAIIALTDADCTVDPDWLRAVAAGLREAEVAICVGHVRFPPQASWALRLLGAYENAKTEYVLTRCEPAYRFAYANNMAVRARVFAELGPFVEWRRAGDTELVHRLHAERPALRTAWHPAMRVTHHEFLRARDRARRMALYTGTNANIEDFRELSRRQRLGTLARVWRAGAHG